MYPFAPSVLVPAAAAGAVIVLYLYANRRRPAPPPPPAPVTEDQVTEFLRRVFCARPDVELMSRAEARRILEEVAAEEPGGRRR